MNTNLRDKILGSLVGFAIGDAMGATTEFMTKEQIKDWYGQVTDIVGGGWLNIPAGRVTDDTEMMLCVADSIVSSPCSRDTLSCISSGFVAWLDSHPIDVGNCCRRSITQNRDFPAEYWKTLNAKRQLESGIPDLGNGGLMRCLVPCLLGEKYLALAQSELTHSNNTCNNAIRDYYEAVNRALTGMVTIHTSVHKEPTGHVDNTLNNAMYWSAGSFKEGILGAVNDGGDADTIAALTGGILGAKFGYSKIYSGDTKQWVDTLGEGILVKLKDLSKYIERNRNNDYQNSNCMRYLWC